MGYILNLSTLYNYIVIIYYIHALLIIECHMYAGQCREGSVSLFTCGYDGKCCRYNYHYSSTFYLQNSLSIKYVYSVIATYMNMIE